MSGIAEWKTKITLDIEDLQKRLRQAEDSLDSVLNKEHKVKIDIDTKTLDSAIKKLDSMLDSLGKGTDDFKQFETLSKDLSKVASELGDFTKAFGKIDDSGTKSLLSSIQNIDKSLSDLSKHILNVNKNMNSIGGNSNNTVKQIENITKANKEAIKSTENLAKSQEKLGNITNVTSSISEKDVSASVESATNSIKEENNVLEQNTQKVKENTQAKEQNVNVNFNKYDKRLDSYNGKIDKYKTTIDRFNDGGWTSNAYLENVQAVKNAVKEYEDLLKELKGKDASLVTSEDINKLDSYEKKIKDTIATVTNMSASEKGYNFVSGQKELDKIHKLLNENSRMSSEAKAKIRAYYAEIESGNPSMSLDRIHGEIMKIYNAEVEAGRAGKSLMDVFKTSRLHQMVAQVAGMFSVYDLVNLGKQAVSIVTDLNTQITELAKVSEQTSKQIYKDFDSYADIAQEMGGTISDTISATADWARNGYNVPDSKELAKVALLYKNVGDGIDIDKANESLISTLRGFKLEADDAEHIIDVFNEVSKNIGEVA